MSAEPGKIHWELHPKQGLALKSASQELLYGGSAGGGKSHLLRIALLLWSLECPGLNSYLFRRELGDLIRNHVEGVNGFLELLSPLMKAGLAGLVSKEIRFLNGSKIFLSHCQHEKDVFGYQGSEIHVLAIEEATQFTEFQIRYLRTRLRIPEDFKAKLKPQWQGKFPRAIYTSNPGGPGHLYLKKAFIDGHIPLSIHTAPENDGGLTRQYIPARLSDNPSLDAKTYAMQLSGAGEQYARALLDGDWNAAVGSFYPEFSYDKHTYADCELPPHWFRFRAFDWGSSAPFVVYWVAVAGDDYQAQETFIPTGSLVVYREWYGCKEGEPTKGLGLRNEEIALGIRERSAGDPCERWHTVTDSLPFQDRGGITIAEVFKLEGVPLTQGDTSRVPGWSLLRARLKGDERGARIFFAQSCVWAIQLLPQAQHDHIDPEELVCVADHVHDALRLAVTSRGKIKPLDKEDLATDNISNNLTFNDVVIKIKEHKRSHLSSGY